MADDLASLDLFVHDLQVGVAKLPRTVARDLGTMGREEVLRVARDVFGADRKFSGAKRSRKAKRVATARYRIFADRVEIQPSGDPFMIFMRGRAGGKRIYPRRAKAVMTPGGPRRWSRVGKLAARPDLLDPAETAIQAKAPRIVSDALDATIVKAL